MGDTNRVLERLGQGVAMVGSAVALVGFVAGAIGMVWAYNFYGPDFSATRLPVTVPLNDQQGLLVLVAGAVCIGVGLFVHLLGSSIAKFAAGVREGQAGPSAGAVETSEAEDGGAGTQAATRVPTSERYRRKLSRFYRTVGVFVAILLAMAILAGDASMAGATDLVGLALSIGAIATTILFGGVGPGIGVLAAFAALWYGVEEAAREALVGGFVVAGLFVLLGVSAGAIGFVIAGLYLVYYNYMARAATDYRWLDRPGGVA